MAVLHKKNGYQSERWIFEIRPKNQLLWIYGGQWQQLKHGNYFRNPKVRRVRRLICNIIDSYNFTKMFLRFVSILFHMIKMAVLHAKMTTRCRFLKFRQRTTYFDSVEGSDNNWSMEMVSETPKWDGYVVWFVIESIAATILSTCFYPMCQYHFTY